MGNPPVRSSRISLKRNEDVFQEGRACVSAGKAVKKYLKHLNVSQLTLGRGVGIFAALRAAP